MRFVRSYGGVGWTRSSTRNCASISSSRSRRTWLRACRQPRRDIAALRRLGGVAQIEEECRDMRRIELRAKISFRTSATRRGLS